MKRILAIIGLCFIALLILFAFGFFIYKLSDDNISMPFYVYGGALLLFLLKILFEWCIENV